MTDEKKLQEEEMELEMELDLEDLEEVSGGSLRNAFVKKTGDITENMKNNV